MNTATNQVNNNNSNKTLIANRGNVPTIYQAPPQSYLMRGVVQPPPLPLINCPPPYRYNAYLPNYPYPAPYGLPHASRPPGYPPVIANHQYSMYSTPVRPAASNPNMVMNTSKKQESLSNANSTVVPNESGKCSSNIEDFDAEKFKEELLNKNGREKGWHLRLMESDRKQIENILDDAVKLQIHFQSFEHEFNQKSSTIDARNFPNYELWNSCKQSLLARRDQTFLVQEETLNKFYMKVSQKPNPSAEVNRQATKPTESGGECSVPEQDVPIKESGIRDKKIESQPIRDEPMVNVAAVNQKTPSLSINDQIENKIRNAKYMSDIAKALHFQEKIYKSSTSIFRDKQLAKSLNDFAFLRNQMSFIDNLISMVKPKIYEMKCDRNYTFATKQQSVKTVEVCSQQTSKKLSEKPNSDSNLKTSSDNDKSKDEKSEQVQTIKIQITSPGQRKVTSDLMKTNKNDTEIMTIDAARLSANSPIMDATSKEKCRSNNIQVPIIRDDRRNKHLKKPNDLNRNRNNNSLKTISTTTIRTATENVKSYECPPPIRPPLSHSFSKGDSTNNYHAIEESASKNVIMNYTGIRNNPGPSFAAREMNSFLESEQRQLRDYESPKPSHGYENPNFFTIPRKYSEEPLSIKDLLDFPGRSYRPSRIVFIIRGLPGSGKTYLAKLIKEREEKNSKLTKIRLLNMDNYYLSDIDDHNESCHSMRTVSHTYNYDPSKEIQFNFMLFKDFREIVTRGYYNFIILDSIYSTIKDVRHFYTCAIENNYIPYVIEMEAIVRRLLNYCTDSEEIIAYCYKHNQHGRSLNEIRSLYSEWQILSEDYLRVNAFPLMAHNASIDASPTVQPSRLVQDDDNQTLVTIPNRPHSSKWNEDNASGSNIINELPPPNILINHPSDNYYPQASMLPTRNVSINELDNHNYYDDDDNDRLTKRFRLIDDDNDKSAKHPFNLSNQWWNNERQSMNETINQQPQMQPHSFIQQSQQQPRQQHSINYESAYFR